MASQKAVIGTRVGGLPEVVSDFETGLLVQSGNPNSLANAILTLLQDRPLCKAMGERGLAFVKAHYDFDQIVDGYLGVYQKALQ